MLPVEATLFAILWSQILDSHVTGDASVRARVLFQRTNVKKTILSPHFKLKYVFSGANGGQSMAPSDGRQAALVRSIRRC